MISSHASILRRCSVAAALLLHCILALPSAALQSGDFSYTDDGTSTTITGCSSSEKSVVIPSSLGGWPVVAIGPEAFSGNSALALVTIPPEVTNLADGAFQDCPGLARVIFEGAAPTLGTDVFLNTSSNLSLYHYTGSTGFTEPEWQGYPIVETAPHPRFRYYRFVTLQTRTTNANSVQLSELSFFWFGKKIAPLSVTNVGGNNAPGEISASLLDRSSATKWLDFNKKPLVFDFGTAIPLDAYAITTANDSPERDPVAWQLQGSANGTAWTTLDARTPSAAPPATRYAAAPPFLIDAATGGPVEAPDVVIVQQIDPFVIERATYGYSTFLAVMATGSPAPTYQWYRGESGDTSLPAVSTTNSYATPSSLPPTNARRYWVRATNSEGSADSDTMVVTVANPQSHFTWTKTNGTVTITRYTGPSGQSVIIPPSIDGSPVTTIGNAAFATRLVSSVTIPASVTSIQGGAFGRCRNLASIIIPTSVTSISAGAFDDCISLPSIILPTSITRIESRVFRGCTSLIEINIPARLTTIFADAFFGCSSLESFVVDTINPAFLSVDGVLFNKSKTTLIRFPDGKSESYAIPPSVTSIGNSAFSGCTSLTGFIITSSVTSIGSNAFDGCTSLTAITIPSSVTSIESRAFSGCTSLISLTIPSSVTSIGSTAFYGCALLQAFVVDPANTAYSSIDGVLFDKSETTLLLFPQGKTGDYVIPDGVTSIGGFSFFYSVNLTSITIPSTVANIESRAFSGCTSLTSITIPSSVTSIGSIAFEGCQFLQTFVVDPANPDYSSIDGVLFDVSGSSLIRYPEGRTGNYSIPDGVTGIEGAAFYQCNSLTAVTIPVSVTSLESASFYYCISLTSAVFEGSAPSLSGQNNFFRAASGFTIWFYSGASGFTTPTWQGYPAAVITPVALWRLQQLGTATSTGPAADSSDPDGDGQNNLAEYTAGTAPLDSGDVFRPISSTFSGGRLTLVVPGKSGRTYVLERSLASDLSAWQPIPSTAIGPLVADGPINLAAPESDPDRAFYRASVSYP